MECGINPVLWRELELIRDRIDLLGDGERANELGNQLLAGQMQSDVPC